MNRTIRSCALRSVTILGYVRAAIVYSPLAFGEAENKSYSNSHHPLNSAEKICILLRRTKATNFANGRSINRADVDCVAFVAANGGELAILVAQKDVNMLAALAGCVVEDGIAWLGAYSHYQLSANDQRRDSMPRGCAHQGCASHHCVG